MALWLTEGEADTYFLTRHGAADYWASGVAKEAVLTTAQNDIVRSGLFTFEDADGNDLTEDPTQAMQDAVCEQALFRLIDEDGIEHRSAIQAQGVVEAGIVKERYVTRDGIALSKHVMALLRDYQTGSNGYGQFTVTR